MYRNKKISFYFPCRNEEGGLLKEMENLPPFIDELVVVSNKSTDNTVEVAKRLGIKTVIDDRVKGSTGYGFAHMTGLKSVSGDIIGTADADGTYPTHKLSDVVDFLIDNKLDFVSCNRYPLIDGANISPIIQFGVKVLNWEVRLLYGRKVEDILSGMWVINSKIKNILGLTEGDWNLSPQIKLNALLNKDIRFAEYHISLNDRVGKSKQNYLKTGMEHMYWIAKNRFSGLNRG